mgnify:CR=1 FL=1
MWKQMKAAGKPGKVSHHRGHSKQTREAGLRHGQERLHLHQKLCELPLTIITVCHPPSSGKADLHFPDRFHNIHDLHQQHLPLRT